jgi:hypothetical protein
LVFSALVTRLLAEQLSAVRGESALLWRFSASLECSGIVSRRGSSSLSLDLARKTQPNNNNNNNNKPWRHVRVQYRRALDEAMPISHDVFASPTKDRLLR